MEHPGLAGPEHGRVDFNPADLGPAVYPLLNSIVLPRPIAWVSTRSQDGHDNLAPHSYFTVASVAPPVVCFTSIGEKDTLRNIRETGEFVVNVTPRGLLAQVNGSSTGFPPERSEFDEVLPENPPRWWHRRGLPSRPWPSSAGSPVSARSARAPSCSARCSISR